MFLEFHLVFYIKFPDFFFEISKFNLKNQQFLKSDRRIPPNFEKIDRFFKPAQSGRPLRFVFPCSAPSAKEHPSEPERANGA
jgi:hypothetical protein